MRKGSKQIVARESRWVDYFLVLMMCDLALFCAGQGINQPIAANILIGISAIGTVVSYTAGKMFRGRSIVLADGWIYTIAALIAFFFQPLLNNILPEDSFKDLSTASLLCWMISLGSFGVWRDGTLLFQAVPSLALFGLVGVYDTFPQAHYLFFGFLLCLALLFGRAHARAMLVQAHRSGFARIEEGVSLSEAAADQDSMLSAMRRGPWRWMAGPEWALASAGAVILISLVGAPIIHDSVKSVTGFVAINVPRGLQRPAPVNTQLPVSATSLESVGTGPRTLGTALVGWISYHKPGSEEVVTPDDNSFYLRSTTYESFIRGSWQRSDENVADDSINETATETRKEELSAIVEPKISAFDIESTQPFVKGVPLPVETVDITQSSGPPDRFQSDGTLVTRGEMSLSGRYEVSALIPGDKSKPRFLASEVDPATAKFLSENPDPTLQGASARVEELGKRIRANNQTDWDRAQAILNEVGTRCDYNLKAPAVPADADPVDYFLFESHQGYCDLFASAVVVLARQSGLNARYCVGYLVEPSTYDDTHHGYQIKQRDAHAWAEIYFHGLGWLPFDATGLAKDVTPKENSGQIDWSAIAKGGGVFALFGIVAAAIYFLPRSRVKAAVRRENAERRKLGYLYQKFSRSLERRSKIRRPASVTPDEWLQRTQEHLGQARPLAEKLNILFVNALYSKVPGEGSISEIEKVLKQFMKMKS